MKAKTTLIALATILAITVLIFQSCKKDDDEEKSNQAPSCQITSPVNGVDIAEGTTLTISVDAKDSDGSISKVVLFIDGNNKGSVSTSPYNFDWNTSNEDLGEHKLKATATDNNGQSTSNEISVTLIATGTAPTASFTASPRNGTAPLAVVFSDQSSNNPINWQWDFGDGGTSTEQNPSHTYNDEGTYTVILTASNEFGSDTKTETDYIATGTAPTASFTASPTNGIAPLAVVFSDQSSNDPIDWQWDFGDGDTSTEQNPSHTYSDEGTYTVTLTASNVFGSNAKTETDYIDVSSENPSGTVTDPRDGQTYTTVTYGNQIWFAENLNYETGTSWCYEDDPANGDIYGRLYEWNTAVTACPDGWHLPSDNEWKILEMYLGMSQTEADAMFSRGTDEGEKMKSISGWANDGNGTNISGFNALPGGHRSNNGLFMGQTYSALWWTSTEYGGGNAWYRSVSNEDGKVTRMRLYESFGYSIRCIKD